MGIGIGLGYFSPSVTRLITSLYKINLSRISRKNKNGRAGGGRNTQRILRCRRHLGFFGRLDGLEAPI